MWPKQKDNSRLVFVKRAHVYHSGRVYMHALYRRRSALDDKLIGELGELSLSPYTRIRRWINSVAHQSAILTSLSTQARASCSAQCLWGKFVQNLMPANS